MKLLASDSESGESRLYRVVFHLLLYVLIFLTSLSIFLYTKSINEFATVIVYGITESNLGDALIVYPAIFFGSFLILALLFIIPFYILKSHMHYKPGPHE